MSEIRHDRITGTWIIIAPKRGRRPGGHAPADNNGVTGAVAPPFVRDCPFCPGNEHLLPSILDEVPRSSPPGWQVRVVPNRYPAVEMGAPETAKATGTRLYETFPGAGRHEVIVEHPRHDLDLATMRDEEGQAVLETCRARYRTLMSEAGTDSVILFRNRGRNAGASIGHPHSQIVALNVVPPFVRERVERSRHYHAQEGRCPVCDLIARESAEQVRLVWRSDHFLALVPFAATSPFEVWVIPLAHAPGFGAASDAHLRDLAMVLRDILGLYRRTLGVYEYNFVVHSAPRLPTPAPYLHWYVQIMPRLTTPAGFEFGSGMRINPSLPEEDAAFLAHALRTRAAENPRRRG
ncbi:MAG: galactose-1-phosphate uridylyltransferase [Alphaproteobacteria bacterium]|nr:MAG: galactose-1-phosphate uridylyltransferase [Alphaproteobacteria bacterium]